MLLSQTTVSIITGIVSGIITAAILALLASILQKIIIPWFEEFVYRGVNISGNWIHTNKDSASQATEIRMDLRQKAHKITGVFQAKSTWEEGKKEYINYYSIRGTVKDNYVLLTYTAQRKDRTGVGSFLLRVAHGGTELNGNAIFTPDGNTNDTIVTVRKDMIFTRN